VDVGRGKLGGGWSKDPFEEAKEGRGRKHPAKLDFGVVFRLSQQRGAGGKPGHEAEGGEDAKFGIR